MKKLIPLFIIAVYLFVTPANVSATTSSCAELIPQHNNYTEPRIDIIFLGFGYKEKDAFVKALGSFIENGFMKVEPTASNKNLFNFLYVLRDELPTRETQEKIKNQIYDTCLELKSSAYTFEVIYFNKTQQEEMPQGAAESGEGAAISFIEPTRKNGYTNTLISSQGYLLVHELVGHALGGLIDEYTLESDDTLEHKAQVSDGVNCFVGTYEQCLTKSPWADLMGQGCGEPNKIDCDQNDLDAYKETGCYEGCRLLTSGAYRPYDTSIMNQKRNDFFGLFQAQEICKKIQEYTDNATGYCFLEFGIGVAEKSEVTKTTKQENNQRNPLINDTQRQQNTVPYSIIKIVSSMFISLILIGGIATGVWYLAKIYSNKK